MLKLMKLLSIIAGTLIKDVSYKVSFYNKKKHDD
jgi:hypothetical protein